MEPSSAVALIIIVFAVYAIISYRNKSSNSKEQATSYTPSDPRKNDPTLKKFNVMGLKHYTVSKKDIGQFNGYAIAETNNKYDKFAVAFYKSNGKIIGFARKETDYLHKGITEQGGKVNLIGEIYTNERTGELQADVYIDYKKY